MCGYMDQSDFPFLNIVSREMVSHFYVLGFGMKHWVLCNTYHTGVVTLNWNMGILLTKVAHGVCDPKELRATTSSGYILGLGSGFEQHSTSCGKTKTPRNNLRTSKSQKWTSYPIDIRLNPRPRIHEEPKRKTQSTKGRSRECVANTWTCAWLLADAKSLEMLENECTHISNIGCPASLLSCTGVTRSCFGTPSSPRAHRPHPHWGL
jgi:hypothetical protein